jgi:hypothetical protein
MPFQISFKMGYEDSVYLAKLAEQAERYEGKSLISSISNKADQ